ncbi:MAG: hypothetical protein WAM97_08465, partial [Acidimicrobiales bacterium]
LRNSIIGFSQWNHSPGPWLVAIGVLVLMIATLLGLALLGLRRNEIGIKRNGRLLRRGDQPNA